MKYYDQKITFEEDHNNGKYDTLIIGRHQEIPDEWLDELRARKNATTDSSFRAREFEEAATIPVSVIELWQRQGFDMFKATLPEILKRLRADNLDVFITGREF